MDPTGCPDPRIDRSPSCCCSPFECQVRVVSCAGQCGFVGIVVASSISRDRNRAADQSSAAPRDRARRSPAACRPAAILRSWLAEPAPAQAGVVEPTAVFLLHRNERRHRRRPAFWSRQGSRRTLLAGPLWWRRRGRCREGLALLAQLRAMPRLPLGRAHRFGADTMSGHAQPRLSIVTCHVSNRLKPPPRGADRPRR
jgi:hypothetical protein